MLFRSIVIGAITEYGMESKGAAFKDFATTKSKAIMAVDIRILDAATGKIAIAETVSESKKASSGVAAAGVNVAEQNEKVLSDVMRQCADSIGNLIVSTLYPVKIISISADGIIMLNYGNGYLNAGEVLDVFSQGKIVKDPDTGEILGAEEQKVGRINVSDVQAKFSKATAIQGAEGLAKGMICRKVPQKQLEDEKKSEKQKNKKELQ